MVLLIFVSATLTIVGIYRLGGDSFWGGISTLANPDIVPSGYWNLFQPNSDKDFPWLPILSGYPMPGLWFSCTDQSMVQPVLAARNLSEGQRGANFTGWLKILDVAIYIMPGIICFALVKTGFFGGMTIEADNAYMTLVSHLFPVGMVGLVLAVLTAALISTIGSALNALSTVCTMDIDVKNIRPQATQAEIARTGRIVTVIGALVSIVITVAVDNIKGMNLFNVFQSVLSFIAPPMAAVFVMGVFWKRCTTLAANVTLTFGTIFSIGTGVLYLWIIPGATEAVHFMLLSFYIFVLLVISMVVVSLYNKKATVSPEIVKLIERPQRMVVVGWTLLAIVMIGLYVFFNGH